MGEVEDDPLDLKIKILKHLSFSKLYSKKKQYKESIKELVQGIYLSSLRHSPESTLIVKQYFDLAGLILVAGEPNSSRMAQRYFEKIVDIWY